MPNAENFDWLLGDWERIGEEPGKQTFEHWWKVSATNYSGIGFTMKNGDTIKQEKIRLVKHNDKWNLEVKVPEEIQPINFMVTILNDSSFICKNDSLDFPRSIRYWKNSKALKAVVSGVDVEIPFFVKNNYRKYLNEKSTRVLISDAFYYNPSLYFYLCPAIVPPEIN